jgi:DNA-binding CsgD family transcriptional regulator
LDPGAHAMGQVLAQSLVALGRLDEAGSALDDFERVLNRTDRVSGRAAAARVRGQVVAALGDWERADTLFAEAAAASETLGMSLASAFAHLAWGLAAIRAGKRKIGTRELILARVISEHSGAQAYALLADRSLGTLGVVPTPGSLIGAGLLTAKEDAVVRLAISGCTNAEMATRLVVNVKTVEYHLTHIYAKLRVTSRRELVTRLSQLAADGGQLGPGS